MDLISTDMVEAAVERQWSAIPPSSPFVLLGEQPR
jgi:hypothetical protein